MIQDMKPWKLPPASPCPPFVVTLLRLGEINETLAVYPGCSTKEQINAEERHTADIMAEYVDYVTGYMNMHDVGILEYAGGEEVRDTVFTDGSIMSLTREVDTAILFLATNIGPEFPIRRLKDIEPRCMEAVTSAAVKTQKDARLQSRLCRQVFAPPTRREQLRYIIQTIIECGRLIVPVLLDREREF